MRDMTTAEFAKANLAGLEEPVTVRRYTKVLGVYHPGGYEPAYEPPVTQTSLALDGETIVKGGLAIASQTIKDLEDEVKRLKRLLSERGIASDKVHVWEPDVLPVKVAANRREDPFSGLSKQDREFFERKLGKKSK